jgi:hypothetical protein
MQAFPRDGRYTVMLRVASRGTSYADLPFTTVLVGGQTPPKAQQNDNNNQKETKNE